MPNSSRRNNREKARKKSRYSSDSDSEREKSRRYREKSKSVAKRRSRERSTRDRDSKNRRKRYSSSSSSSSDSSRSSSSSSRSARRSSSSEPATSRASSRNFEQVTKFEINDLYKEEDKAKILDSIEADSFKQEKFQSKKKIVVDLKKGDLKVPENLGAEPEEESLIHPDFLGDEETKVDKWIKKLNLYRNSN